MSKIVNLNRARKDRARSEDKATADRNAVLHGRTKAEREKMDAMALKIRSALDAHKRDT